MLTNVQIRKARSAEKPYKLFDDRGLYLIVTPEGGKWWRLKYRHAEKEKTISLGTYPDVTLAKARERRDEARRLLVDGRDPSAERRAAKQEERSEDATFEVIAREWLEKFSAVWTPLHRETIVSRLERDVFGWIGKRQIAEITAPELLQALRRVEERGAVETAHRIKGIIGQVFRFAIATGRAIRDPSADLRGALVPVREEHLAAVTKPADVAALMRAIDGYQGSFVVRCALRFTALTFARPGEIRKAEWTEIDFDGSLWRIAAERMKMRREHLVPLSKQAIEILHQLHPLTGSGRYLFPGRTHARPMSENAVLAALRYLGYEQGTMTAHGFRRMASTLLNESGKWSGDAIERQLAHAETDEVRAAYNAAEHLPERVRMMQWWADHLDQLKTGASILPFRVPTPALAN